MTNVNIDGDRVIFWAWRTVVEFKNPDEQSNKKLQQLILVVEFRLYLYLLSL